MAENGRAARFYCLREQLVADLNLNDLRNAFGIGQFSDQDCYLVIHRNRELLYELLAALYRAGRYQPISGTYRLQIDINHNDLAGLKGKINAKRPIFEEHFDRPSQP
jgi:hypothetical protein